MKSTADARTINVEVAYAAPENQILFGLRVAKGATVSTVLEACAKGELLPADVLNNPDVGVFGRMVPTTHVLKSGDRVELYRPLVADPKDTRRERASTNRHRRGQSINRK